MIGRAPSVILAALDVHQQCQGQQTADCKKHREGQTTQLESGAALAWRALSKKW